MHLALTPEMRRRVAMRHIREELAPRPLPTAPRVLRSPPSSWRHLLGFGFLLLAAIAIGWAPFLIVWRLIVQTSAHH